MKRRQILIGTAFTLMALPFSGRRAGAQSKQAKDLERAACVHDIMTAIITDDVWQALHAASSRFAINGMEELPEQRLTFTEQSKITQSTGVITLDYASRDKATTHKVTLSYNPDDPTNFSLVLESASLKGHQTSARQTTAMRDIVNMPVKIKFEVRPTKFSSVTDRIRIYLPNGEEPIVDSVSAMKARLAGKDATIQRTCG